MLRALKTGLCLILLGAALSADARVTRAGGVYFHPNTQAFFARLATPPDTATAIAYDNFISSLTKSGIWSKFDALYVFAAPDTATANTNLISSAFTLSQTGTMTFTPYQGYTSVSGTNYLSGGFNPAAGSYHFSLNSSSMVAVLNSLQAGNNNILSIGGNNRFLTNGANGMQIAANTTSAAFPIGVSASFSFVGDCPPCLTISSQVGTAAQAWYNGQLAQAWTIVQPSALTTGPDQITAVADLTSMVGWGAAFTQSDNMNFYAATKQFFSDLNGTTPPIRYGYASNIVPWATNQKAINPTILRVSDGRIICFWENFPLAGGSTTVWYSVSGDGGYTWSTPTQIVWSIGGGTVGIIGNFAPVMNPATGKILIAGNFYSGVWIVSFWFELPPSAIPETGAGTGGGAAAWGPLNIPSGSQSVATGASGINAQNFFPLGGTSTTNPCGYVANTTRCATQGRILISKSGMWGIMMYQTTVNSGTAYLFTSSDQGTTWTSTVLAQGNLQPWTGFAYYKNKTVIGKCNPANGVYGTADDLWNEADMAQLPNGNIVGIIRNSGRGAASCGQHTGLWEIDMDQNFNPISSAVTVGSDGANYTTPFYQILQQDIPGDPTVAASPKGALFIGQRYPRIGWMYSLTGGGAGNWSPATSGCTAPITCVNMADMYKYNMGHPGGSYEYGEVAYDGVSNQFLWAMSIGNSYGGNEGTTASYIQLQTFTAP
jgi:hypothetical protein